MPAKLEYDDKEFRARMNRAVKEMPDIVMKAMLRAVLKVIEKMPAYPPEKPTYVYTFTLERTMSGLAGVAPDSLSKVERIGGDVVGLVGTSLNYAPFVIDKEAQVSFHRGRWWTLQDHVEGMADEVAEIVIGDIDIQI